MTQIIIYIVILQALFGALIIVIYLLGKFIDLLGYFSWNIINKLNAFAWIYKLKDTMDREDRNTVMLLFHKYRKK